MNALAAHPLMQTITHWPLDVSVQEIPAALCFCARREVAPDGLAAARGWSAGELYRAARRAGLEASGPERRIYRIERGGENSNLGLITLQVALPIAALPARLAAATAGGEFFFQIVPPFRCLVAHHCGPLSEVDAAWAALAGQARAAGLSIAGQRRELLRVFDWPESAENVTELQLGITEATPTL